MAICIRCGAEVQPGDRVLLGEGVNQQVFCSQQHKQEYLVDEESGKGQVKHASVAMEVSAEIPTEVEEPAPAPPKQRKAPARKAKRSA